MSSIGWYENPLQLPFTGDNPDIEIGRHAIAIDERRAFFRTNLWIPKGPPPHSGPRDLKQVWFPGVHCDVGGGYPEPESGLSKIALRWMLKEAITAGLLVIPGRMDLVLGRSGAYAVPDAHAEMHDSLTGLLVVGRSSLEAALQLGQAKVGAPDQPGPAAHHPAKLAHPQIGLSTRWRLCEASAPRCDPDKLIVVFGASPAVRGKRHVM